MTGSPTPPIRRPSCSGGSTASMARPAGPTRTPAITATTASFSIDRTRPGERSHVPALGRHAQPARRGDIAFRRGARARDRKSTRLNSSHGYISYAVFCLKKKKQTARRDDKQTEKEDNQTIQRHLKQQ